MNAGSLVYVALAVAVVFAAFDEGVSLFYLALAVTVFLTAADDRRDVKERKGVMQVMAYALSVFVLARIGLMFLSR